MFECQILALLPIRAVGEEERFFSIVATYDFDAGLQPKDHIRINNAAFMTSARDGVPTRTEPTFSFDAMVLNRKRYVNCAVPQDKFILAIEIEIADKEVIPAIVEHLQTRFPGSFERPEIEPDSN